MRSPRGLWVSRYFTFPRRFEKLGQLIDEIMKKFGYEAVRFEQFEDWVQVYHQPPVKLVVVYTERIYSEHYDSNWGSWSSTPGSSRAELTFFAPDYAEMERICSAIREEINGFKDKLRNRDKERLRKTRKDKEQLGSPG